MPLFHSSALQIFKKIDHPSAFKMGSGSKEGLSLFGILNRTRSRPGKRLLRLWFNRPLSDKVPLTSKVDFCTSSNITMNCFNQKELERRLDTVDYFVRPQNLEIMRKLQESLKNLRNLNVSLQRVKCNIKSSLCFDFFREFSRKCELPQHLCQSGLDFIKR